MVRPLAKIGAALLMALSLTVAQAQQGATRMDSPQPVENDGKVEVLEFFAYGCSHCANLEPAFAAWIKKQPATVKVRRIPSPAPLMGIDSTVVYYSLEALGQHDRLHAKIFEAVHDKKEALGNPLVLNKWLDKNGVDPKKYVDAQKSFSVATKVARARQMLVQYKLRVTPTIIVNGRFSVEPDGSSPEAMFAKIDRLIADAQLEITAAPVPSTTRQTPKKTVSPLAK